MGLFCDLLLDKLKLTSYHRRRKKYDIGEYSYICETTNIGSAKIGKFCSIARNVSIGVGSHPMNFLTTSPFIYSRKKVTQMGNILVDEKDFVTNKTTLPKVSPAIIGNDVYIGEKATILLGVKVGDGAVIGANAVVTKDVPPYAIVAGIPAKVIRYRFEQDVIDKLEKLQWWDYPKEFIVKLPFHDINECIKILEEHKDMKVTK